MSLAPRSIGVPGVAGVAAARHVMLLLDGASLEYIWPRVAKGRLPNFARLLETGASIDLATVRPTQPDPVWAAVATGMYPPRTACVAALLLLRARRRAPIALLPDHCFSHALVHLGIVPRRAERRSSCRGGAAALEHLADAGISGRRRPLAADVSRAAGARLPDQRSISTTARLVGGSTSARRIRGRAAGRPRGVCRAATAGGAARSACRFEPRPEGPLAARPSYSREIAMPGATVGRAVARGALPGPRHGRPLLHCGTRAARVRRPSEQEAPPSRRCSIATTAYIDAEIGRAIERWPGAICCSSCRLRHGAARMPSSGCSAAFLGDPSERHARARARRLSCWRMAPTVEPGRSRGSIVDVAPTVLYFLGLPSAATWTATRCRPLHARVHGRPAHRVHPDHITGEVRSASGSGGSKADGRRSHRGETSQVVKSQRLWISTRASWRRERRRLGTGPDRDPTRRPAETVAHSLTRSL